MGMVGTWTIYLKIKITPADVASMLCKWIRPLNPLKLIHKSIKINQKHILVHSRNLSDSF